MAFLCSLSFGCGRQTDAPPRTPDLPQNTAELDTYLEAFPWGQFEIHDVPNVGKFYIDDNPTRVKKALRNGEPFSAHLIEEFKKYAVPGTTALDVGAHIGSLTVPLARLIGPEGRVVAFEPQKKVHRELVHNLRLNDLANATALRLAVSSEPGIVEMSPVWLDDGWTHIGKGGEKVEARTIDSFGFSNLSLIKIDVEGHELEVLKGAEKTITSLHPVLLIELRRSNLEVARSILSVWGYSLRGIAPKDLPLNMDYLAIYEGE